MTTNPYSKVRPVLKKNDADYVFYELTRSICPDCRRVIDAQIILRNNKVYMRKRCPEHGQFEALIYSDAQLYTSGAKFNKPGTIPLEYAMDIKHGCPYDCGLCPDHQQHTCLGIIEVTSACNMHCPLCFADAGGGYSYTLQEVEAMLDSYVAAEGRPEVVQFSGGEPTIHPDIIAMIKAAQARNIRTVMLNTNGRRIANDDVFLAQLAEVHPAIYFQFDGFESETYRKIRGEPDLFPEKLRALDRLASIGCAVILVPAIERGVNDHEVGRILKFGMEHPAVRGINFQPAFHAGRFDKHNPLERVTIPDVTGWIEAQTDGMFLQSDFVPVPCCFPTCNSVTYAYVEGETVMPITRLIQVEDYLDYISNRVLPDLSGDLKTALESLWSSSSVPGSSKTVESLSLTCASCGLPDGGLDLGAMAQHFFMIMLQDFADPWTFDQKSLMKCCKEILLPDGKQIPICAYNNLGYREQAREQLVERQRMRKEAENSGIVFTPQPITFKFNQSQSGDGRKE